MEEEVKLTPQQYFDQVKDKKKHCTDETLNNVYDNCLTLLNKYKITNQVAGIRKLLFQLDCIEKEREIIKLGVDTFVYRNGIEDYIDNVADDAVKIIELENYTREIPDEIVEVIEKTKDKFDRFYVVFTDYTGKEERRVEAERKEKDPILFGAFMQNRDVAERFYYLGDWVDEYCDLTLEKMTYEVKCHSGTTITRTIKTPEDIEELKQQLKGLVVNNQDQLIVGAKPPKKSFFDKIKSIFSKKK